MSESMFTRELESKIETISVKDIWEKINDNELKPHICQRDIVWKNVKKVEYIKCMFKGCQMSGLYFNKDSEGCLYQVDGQNRCIAIYDFLENRLNIGNKIDKKYFNDLIKSDQRKFKDIKIGVTILEDWDDESCEDLFENLQKGDSLTNGERIQASQSTNIISQECKKLINKHIEYFTKSVINGGMELSNNRYKLYSEFAGLINMIIDNGFPLRLNSQGFKIYNMWNKIEDRDEKDKLNEKIIEAIDNLEKIIATYKILKLKCPKLQVKITKKQTNETKIYDATNTTTTYRCFKFIHMKNLHNSEITDDIALKFNNMLDATHKCDTPESKKIYNNIILQATTDISKVFDEYDLHYN